MSGRVQTPLIVIRKNRTFGRFANGLTPQAENTSPRSLYSPRTCIFDEAPAILNVEILKMLVIPIVHVFEVSDAECGFAIATLDLRPVGIVVVSLPVTERVDNPSLFVDIAPCEPLDLVALTLGAADHDAASAISAA